MRIALTIAGSDSSGGAGLQADLKKFAGFGVYGASAITAVTVQSTKGVEAGGPVSADLGTAQIEAGAGDFTIDPTKIGMLADGGLITGGHGGQATSGGQDLPAEVVDLVFDGHAFHECRAPRIDSRHTHGTGCTFASAVAASLALGRELLEAARLAQWYVAGAIAHAPGIGHGRGPLDHFWEQHTRSG